MPQQYQHTCRRCGREFLSNRANQKYCPEALGTCRLRALGMYAENKETEDQYQTLDGNLRRVLNKLRAAKEDRKHLRLGDLIELWNKQKGRCAITGIEMTYRAQEGVCFPYNVSIDRILPKFDGGTYALNNIQLVCKVANVLKQHYRGAEVKDAIRSFAEKVIKGQEQAHARFDAMPWAPAYMTSTSAGLVVRFGDDVQNTTEALTVNTPNNACPEPDQRISPRIRNGQHDFFTDVIGFG
jgi:hypothetical protein